LIAHFPTHSRAKCNSRRSSTRDETLETTAGELSRQSVAGSCSAHDLADSVLRKSIRPEYFVLRISTALRIEELIKELRDTIASVYAVPNIFAFDLVQKRRVEINSMPA